MYPHSPKGIYDDIYVNIVKYLRNHIDLNRISDTKRARFIGGLMRMVDKALAHCDQHSRQLVEHAHDEQRSRTFNQLMNQIAHPGTPPKNFNDIPF
jgi:hypothetical protein